MTDIDRLLTEAGERWRAAQPAAPSWAPVPGPRGVARVRLGSIILAAALVAVLAASFGLNAGGPRPPASHIGIAWNRVQLVAAAVHRGDQVSATGVVIAQPGGIPQVCLGGASRLMPNEVPRCSKMAADLEGADLSTLPGRTEASGVVESGFVTVRGTWTGTAISVKSITPATFDAGVTAADVPCPEPEGGWIDPPSQSAFRAALKPLVDEITAHPETYGRYLTEPEGAPSVETGPAIEFVTTKVDPATVHNRVESLFPFAACLFENAATTSELAATAAELQRPDGSWSTWIVATIGRVAVNLAVLDDAAVAIFVAHRDAIPVPFVVKDRGVASEPTASNETTATAPVATPIGSLETANGIPVAIDGEPVLVGDAATSALEGSVDTTSILIGGWLHPAQLIACRAIGRADQWNTCAAARLFPSPFDGPEARGIFHGTGSVALPEIPDGMVEAVVLRVHTHDPGCAPSGGCTTSAVLDAVVWQGGLEPTPTPTSSAPASGLTLPAAIEAATRVTAGNGGRELVVTAAVAGPYAVVGPSGSDVAGDRWVWAVTLHGSFAAPGDCLIGPGSSCGLPATSSLVVLDYVDGSFLISSTPADGSPTVPDSGSSDAMTVVSKFEVARALANWDEAWGLLAPMSQKAIGSEATFIEFETAYNVAGGGFEIGQIVAGPFDATTTDYIGSVVLGDLVRSGGTVSEAHLVYVNHPDEAGASASSAAYLVALVDGKWRIWIAH
jgi:hypothetical protein